MPKLVATIQTSYWVVYGLCFRDNFYRNVGQAVHRPKTHKKSFSTPDSINLRKYVPETGILAPLHVILDYERILCATNVVSRP